MKTASNGSMRENTRRTLWASIIILAVSCGLADPGRARDLKSFAQSESYLADGQTLAVTQKLGHAIIQFDPAAMQNTTPTMFVAPDNTSYVLEVDLNPARGLYT